MVKTICCPCCGELSWSEVKDELTCLSCGHRVDIQNDILILTPNESLLAEEAVTRDRQASGYLQHCKFPTQKDSIQSFLNTLPECMKAMRVLDLGCGPGPSTELLELSGFNQTESVDFSFQSLLINRNNLSNLNQRFFLRADLNAVSFAEKSCGILIMTDFLQHIGDWVGQQRFLRNAANALEIDGKFYLSCFNLNIKNYIRGDVHGTFSNGTIPYSRIHHKEISHLLPDFLEIEEIYPMNIFNSPMPDRLARRMPGAFFLGRMIVVTGRRIQ